MKSNILVISLLAAVSLSNSNIWADEPSKPAAPPVAEVVKNDFTTVLQQNSLELISWAKESAQKTGNFAAEQTPLFIKEYIAWIFWSNILSFATFLIPVIIFPCLAVKFYNKITGWNENRKSIYDDKGLHIGYEPAQFGLNNVFFIVFAVCSVASTITFLCNGPASLSLSVKSLVAPRVVIVDKLTEMVKK